MSGQERECSAEHQKWLLWNRERVSNILLKSFKECVLLIKRVKTIEEH